MNWKWNHGLSSIGGHRAYAERCEQILGEFGAEIMQLNITDLEARALSKSTSRSTCCAVAVSSLAIAGAILPWNGEHAFIRTTRQQL